MIIDKSIKIYEQFSKTTRTSYYKNSNILTNFPHNIVVAKGRHRVYVFADVTVIEHMSFFARPTTLESTSQVLGIPLLKIFVITHIPP